MRGGTIFEVESVYILLLSPFLILCRLWCSDEKRYKSHCGALVHTDKSLATRSGPSVDQI
jgi:hypothetical protein